jgi:ankyrin repeat protein
MFSFIKQKKRQKIISLVRDNNVEEIKNYLRINNCENLEVLDQNDIPIIIGLIEDSKVEIIELFVNHNIFLKYRFSFNGDTIAHIAIQKGWDNIFYSLLKSKFDINQVNDNNETLIMYAIMHKRYHLIEPLIKVRINLNLVNKNGENCLHLALKNPFYSKNEIVVFNLLLKNKEDIDQLDKNDFTPFYYLMIYQSNNKSLSNEMFLDYTKYIQNINCHYKVLEYFLKKFNSTDVYDSEHSVSLTVIKFFFNSNFDTSLEINPQKQNIFHLLSDNKYIPIYKYIKFKNQDGLNKSDKSFITPIMESIKQKNDMYFNFLLTNRAETEVNQFNRLQPIHIACNTMNYELLKILIAKDCKLNAKDAHGNTALHYLCRNLDLYFDCQEQPKIILKMIYYILEHGANSDIQNIQFNKPIDMINDNIDIKNLISNLFESYKSNNNEYKNLEMRFC